MTTETVIKIHDINSFVEQISSGLSIVDYTATWCGPCRRVGPQYEFIATEYTKVIPQLQFLKVDVDEVPELAQEVTGLPTFQFWVDGQRVDSLTVMGANVEKLRASIVDLIRGTYTLPVTKEPSVNQGAENVTAVGN